MQHYYLAQYEYIEPTDVLNDEGQVIGQTSPEWRWPHKDKIVGSLDLRPVIHQGMKGESIQGYGLFAYSEKTDPNGGLYLGTNLADVLNQGLKRNITDILKPSPLVVIGNVVDSLWDQFTLGADVTGQIGVKPAKPVRSDGLAITIRFGGETYRRKVIRPGVDPEWATIMKAEQESYRAMKGTGIDGNNAERYLTVLSEKYGLAPEMFIPDDMPKVAALPHKTIYNVYFESGEGFSDGQRLQDHADWSVAKGSGSADSTNSNWVYNPGGGNYWVSHRRYQLERDRYDTDMSSADMYAQKKIYDTDGSSTAKNAVCARFASAADTCYEIDVTANNDTVNFYKCITDTLTPLDSNKAVTINTSTYYTIRIECEGTQMRSYVGGTKYHDFGPETSIDGSIVGGLRSGVMGQRYYSSVNVFMDDFEVGDITGGGPTSNPLILQSNKIWNRRDLRGNRQ